MTGSGLFGSGRVDWAQGGMIPKNGNRFSDKIMPFGKPA